MADREQRKKEVTERRQEQILNAAIEVFAEKGYIGATIPQIAKKAGVAAGTIYIYYPNKRELFVAVIEKNLVEPMVKIFENRPGQRFSMTLKEVLIDRLNILESKEFSRLTAMISEIQRDPELKAILVEHLFRPTLARMELIVRSQMDTGEFRHFDPEVVIRFIPGLMIGLNFIRNIEGEASPINKISQDKLVDELMNFILYGLAGEGKKEANSTGEV
jgi:AcrR family transcriptional regulator